MFYCSDVGLRLRSAVIAEEFSYLRGNGRHDRRVEERVESGEQERADDNRDENLYAGIDVTLAAGVGERGLRAESGGGELVLDGSDDLFIYFLPHIFLILLNAKQPHEFLRRRTRATYPRVSKVRCHAHSPRQASAHTRGIGR